MSSQSQVTPLTLSTIAYVALWQFGQFPLFTQLCSLYVLKVTGVLSRKIFGTYVHDAIVSSCSLTICVSLFSFCNHVFLAVRCHPGNRADVLQRNAADVLVRAMVHVLPGVFFSFYLRR